MVDKALTQQRRQPSLLTHPVLGCSQNERAPSVMHKLERHLRTGQRHLTNHALDMAELRAFGTHELAPRRRIEKEIMDIDTGARRMRRRARPLDPPETVADHLMRMPAIGRPGYQAKTGDRRDARQRLASKTETLDALQILQAANLAGGMTLQRQRQIPRIETNAIVGHPNPLQPGALYIDTNTPGARVEAVLHQLLDHGGRTSDNLAGCDLIDQLRRKSGDATHNRTKLNSTPDRVEARHPGGRRETLTRMSHRCSSRDGSRVGHGRLIRPTSAQASSIRWGTIRPSKEPAEPVGLRRASVRWRVNLPRKQRVS